MELEELDKAVEAALDPDTFDLGEFLQNGGVTTPRETVVCYTDQDTGYQLMKLNSELAELDRNPEYKGLVSGVPEEVRGPLIEKQQKLAQKLVDSAMTFSLQMVPPTLWDSIQKKTLAMANKQAKAKDEPAPEVETPYDWQQVELVRYSIEKLEIPGKQLVKERKAIGEPMFSHDSMRRALRNLQPNEAQKLRDAATVMLFGVPLSDQRIDAGFPGGTTDEG